MKKWVIVPEGLSDNSITNKPSFVYQAVLDWLIENSQPEDIVYLAPANCFGGSLAEDEVAEAYLKEAKVNFTIKSIKNLQRCKYIDTYGNAAILKNTFPLEDFSNTYLVCGKYHQLRSYLCFRACGFDITKVVGVNYSRKNNHPIVRRLFYYQYPMLHILYEFIAIQREILRWLRRKLIHPFFKNQI